jgi:uncharacterized membrane protein (UPF0127 family)
MRRAFCALLFAFACQSQATEKTVPQLREGSVRFETPRGPWVVRVEIAANEADRARGLMFRRQLGQDHGMLFVFDRAEEHSFWMHNTLISLDLIFVGDDRRVVGAVAGAPPQTDAPRTVGKPSRYVVEVLAGEAAAHAVGPGTPVAFIDIPE